jgi:hypothetical protein
MSTPARHRSHARLSTRQWCVAFVLVALVCAQALGFMHRATHQVHAGGYVRAEHAVPSAHADAHEHAGTEAAAGWLQALFGQHEDETDCRLYDGLGSQVFACPLPAGLAAMAPAQAFLSLLAGEFVARWAALFDARGPPASR